MMSFGLGALHSDAQESLLKDLGGPYVMSGSEAGSALGPKNK